jgi:hypothetical protein
MTAQIIAVALIAATQATADPKPPRTPLIPLRVQVTVSTYQGEKKISSAPYTLSVTAVPPNLNLKLSQLRMGTKIPLAAAKPTAASAKAPADAKSGQTAAGSSVTYHEIGTNIDLTALIVEEGRYELQITVEDNSIPREEAARAAKTQELPSIRAFRLSNRVILRDGQSTQFTAATDRVSGETVRIDVTLNVVE